VKNNQPTRYASNNDITHNNIYVDETPNNRVGRTRVVINERSRRISRGWHSHHLVPLPRAARRVSATSPHAFDRTTARHGPDVAQPETLPYLLSGIPRRFVARRERRPRLDDGCGRSPPPPPSAPPFSDRQPGIGPSSGEEGDRNTMPARRPSPSRVARPPRGGIPRPDGAATIRTSGRRSRTWRIRRPSSRRRRRRRRRSPEGG
jgi:hypothetical protein